MKKTSIKEITTAINGKMLYGNPLSLVDSLCIDSRKVTSEDLFFALIGENQDGHKYLNDVIESGCNSIIASHDKGLNIEKLKDKGIGLIMVEDTTKALQDLANYYINKLNIKKIGVTGSVGKTTTKEMLYWVFSEKFKSFRNQGNLNNHIGLPLSVLAMEEDTEVGIFEMGMSEFGEIDLLARIVKPHIGIITNIGTSHIENLKSREGILKAKLEITNYFGRDNLLILNSDVDLLDISGDDREYKVIKVGTNGKSQFIISNIVDNGENGTTFSLEHNGLLQNFVLNLPGRHNAYNAALAIAAGVVNGVSLEEAAAGLLKMQLTDKRLSIKGKNGIKIIDDTYNASPESMKAAIDVLQNTKGLRKMAILGDMLEMGDKSEEFHYEVGEYLGQNKVDLVFCVGNAAKQIAKGAETSLGSENIIYGKTKDELYEKILNTVSVGDVILVKGSRGMEMDIIVRKIMEKE